MHSWQQGKPHDGRWASMTTWRAYMPHFCRHPLGVSCTFEKLSGSRRWLTQDARGRSIEFFLLFKNAPIALTHNAPPTPRGVFSIASLKYPRLPPHDSPQPVPLHTTNAAIRTQGSVAGQGAPHNTKCKCSSAALLILHAVLQEPPAFLQVDRQAQPSRARSDCRSRGSASRPGPTLTRPHCNSSACEAMGGSPPHCSQPQGLHDSVYLGCSRR